jgi:hypothetical protein
MSNSDHFPDYETVEYHLIYSALINAARYRGTVTYQELAHMVGLPLVGNYMGRRIGNILGAVSQNEVQHQRPMLSALAATTNGIPGGGFFTYAKDLELLKSDHPTDQGAFWKDQKRQCYETWQQKFHKPESK